MKTFSIRELESFSGIKAHTIRTWELRYNIFIPRRRNGIRQYSIDDVERLLNMALLLENGLKISQLVHVEISQLEERTMNLLTEEAKIHKAIYQLIMAMFMDDIEEFEKILDACNISWGIDITIEQVILPFLEKVNILSYSDTSPGVHFVVTAVRKKLIVAIESTDTPLTTKAALLFLPKNEHYDLLLLYIAYAVKKTGIRMLYLGTDISPENVLQVVRAKNPDYLLTYISPQYRFNIGGYIDLVKDITPQPFLFVTGSNHECRKQRSAANVCFIHYTEVFGEISEREAEAKLRFTSDD